MHTMADLYDALDWLRCPAVVSCIVSGIFVALTPSRAYFLRNEKTKVKSGTRAHVKLFLVALLAALGGGEIAMPIILSNVPIYDILDVAFSFAGVVGLAWLSFLEHRRSVRPSALVCLYLLASVTSDLYMYTFPAGIYRKRGPFPFVNTLVAQIVLKTVLLVLESLNKKSLLLVNSKDYAETDLVGILNRVTFWWINPILKTGNKRILTPGDMPNLDTELNTKRIRDRVLQQWDSRETPEPKNILARVLYRTLRTPFLLAAIPRLFVILFRCGQPILINKVIAFVQQSLDEYDYAYQAFYIMLASITIYIGLTFAESQYNLQLSRLEIMIRSSLTALIYNKTLSRNYDDVDAGHAMTLMGSDIEGVSETAEMAHETWAYVTELVVGIVILASQVKWFWPVPLAIIFLCSRVSKYVAQNLRPRQKAWSEATQLRMSVLTPVLSNMKSVKATGVSGNLEEYVGSLREKEIAAAKHLAWMQVVYNASANALGIFSPAITVVLFATVQHVRGEPLDSQVMFTTIAVLSIITHPANMVMTIIPRVITSLANFERLQSYLQATQSAASSAPAEPSHSTDAVTMTNFTFSAAKDSRTVLDNLNLSLKEKTTTICCGPVGSGKSVLARGILGEIQQSHGVYHRQYSSLGFCDQNPWIPTGTIKDIICGFSSNPDESRYNEVLETCCLSFDLLALPAMDLTWIGSRGINLSGGQKLRIAVARLLYSSCETAVFDDSFAALDGATEQTVVENLFGPEGYVKKTNMTVFWVTNSAQYFHMADNIIVLNKGAIEKQGPWEDIKQDSTELRKFSFKESAEQEQKLTPQDVIKKSAKEQAEKDAEADLHRRTGDASLYGYYLRAAGIGALILLPVTSIYSFGNTVPSYWIKIWTENQSHFALYAIGYGIIAFLAWASTSINMWTFAVLMGPNAGRVLHQKLLTSIFGAPLEYFSNLDVGVTLNRFGQDIGLVDRQLARAFATVAIQICKMATQIIVILAVQKYVSATLPVCAIITYFVQKIYLRTSRQLRVLEIEAKASLYSTFVETVEGVLTIRAFGWQNAIEDKALSALDVSLRPYYLLRCLQRWLNLVLELIVGTIAIGMIAMSVVWGYGSGADIGVALNVVLVANTTLVRLVQSWASLEVSLGAVARLKNVEEHTASEDRKSKTIVPDHSWPSHGKLMLSDVSIGYSAGNHVLKNLNLTVEPGQKLVVCGRTGSGKSTIFLGLLALIESEGIMLVDGVDLGQVPKSVIRERAFIAVPQDAGWIPHASLRFNIDPALLAGDYVLQDALDKVGLWDIFSGSGDSAEAVLDLPLRSLPALSVGQSQLLAIARAIIKKQLSRESQMYTDNEETSVVKPIVLLDEITSSMDGTTESKIYDIIDSEFLDQGYTVIVVSHRLGALGKSMRPGKDAVAIVNNGGVTLENDFAKFLEQESQDAASS